MGLDQDKERSLWSSDSKKSSTNCSKQLCLRLWLPVLKLDDLGTKLGQEPGTGTLIQVQMSLAYSPQGIKGSEIIAAL